MIAAIYARKSTEQTVAEDQKSVARQISHARAYATRNGWRVDDACVFADDGISGSEFAARPGYQQLLARLKPRPPFDVLIMSESSRLGREAWETGFALKQILVAGVRVFFYLENRECTFEHPLDKLQFSIVQAFDEMERSRATQRATDKALSQARAGHVTGGRVFGYACTAHHTRGRTVCSNRVQMPMACVDEAVIAALRDEVVTPDLVDDVLARLRELVDADRGSSDWRDRLVDDLAAIDRELANLAEAIAMGGNLPAFVARARGADQRRKELLERLRMLGDGPVVPRIDWRATESQARQLLADWRGVLVRQPHEARPLLRELLAGEPIRFTPIDESTRRGYRFEASAVIGGLLEGVVVTNGNWRPHRDSNPGFSLERAAS
jgi:DNA invertase Pin-like site-specific DNA recombinase